MKKYSEWIGVGFEKSMLKSKIGKIEWDGNRTDNKKSKGLNPDFFNSFKNDSPLSLNQRIIINRYFFNIMDLFNYDLFNQDEKNQDELSFSGNNIENILPNKTKERDIKSQIKSIIKYDFFKYKLIDLFMDKESLKSINESFKKLKLKSLNFLIDT